MTEKNVPSDGEVRGGCLVDMQDDNKWVRQWYGFAVGQREVFTSCAVGIGGIIVARLRQVMDDE